MTRLQVPRSLLQVLLLVPAACVALQALAQGPSPQEPMLAAMEAEMARASQALSHTPTPATFVSLEVVENHLVRLQAEEGGLQGGEPDVLRRLDADVRIGSPRLDSTHPLRGGGPEKGSSTGRSVPLTDDPHLLSQVFWRELDRRYQGARERWARVESDRQVLVGEPPAWDLAPVTPVQEVLTLPRPSVDLAAWQGILRRVSSVLARSEVSYDGSVQLAVDQVTRWFASSEGTRIRDGYNRFTVRANLDTVAEDGARLALTRSWDARDPAGLPDEATLKQAVVELERTLAALRSAPLQEPYSGPAILSDRAAAVFFHEILGHRLEGERLKRVDDAQTLKDLVGQPILPRFLSMVDDPTLETWGDQALMGHYRFDSEGVRAQRVDLVRDGILQGFLQSRATPSDAVLSNGHGRRQSGYEPTSRQGNLMVTAREHVEDAQLRAELVALARKAGLEYGLYVEEIQGGFTLTGRRIPNAFNVDVVLGYRVFVDGRPDQLVRGMDLIGTPLVTLSRIVRAGETHRVFNGTCGAESGSVPVSAVSPALLVSQVETQRKARSQMTPALLPAPTREVAP